MTREAENRCPICRTVLGNGENAVCPRCGRIHIAKMGLSIRDREHDKWIDNFQKIYYVTDNLFAYDKSDQSSGALQSGIRAGLAHAGPIGWVAGAAINTAIDVAQDKARESKQAKKVVSTAVCYDWKSIASLTYPTDTFKIMLAKMEGRRCIEMKLTSGITYTLVFDQAIEVVKEIYEKMDELHRKSITRNPVTQAGYPDRKESALTGKQFTQEPPRQVSAPTYAKISPAAAPEFFKCAYCGVTQMREGNFCAYCGKPAPVSKPEKQETAVQKEIIVCPHCGNRQDTGGKFCFRCGQKLAAEPAREKVCPHCGAKVQQGMLFCMECGTKV